MVRFRTFATLSVTNCMNDSTSTDELNSTRPRPRRTSSDLRAVTSEDLTESCRAKMKPTTDDVTDGTCDAEFYHAALVAAASATATTVAASEPASAAATAAAMA